MRHRVAAWTAGVVAAAVLALGGLVVVKPAIDNWDSLYRGDPFEAATTQKDFTNRSDHLTATATTKQEASAIERVLGRSGLLLLRLSLVAIAAFLLASVVQRAILAEYGLRIGRVGAPAPVESPPERLDGSRALEEPQQAEAPTRNGPTAPELGSASLAPPIAKLIASRREELGISQRELAKRAGISHTVVSRIEQGEQTPSRRTLERLADALRGAR
jgi:DNA-binding XRE family transcriptional regulator